VVIQRVVSMRRTAVFPEHPITAHEALIEEGLTHLHRRRADVDALLQDPAKEFS
jgi:hypothetical protein